MYTIYLFVKGLTTFMKVNKFRQAWNFHKFLKYEKMSTIRDDPRTFKHNSNLLTLSNNYHIFAK